MLEGLGGDRARSRGHGPDHDADLGGNQMRTEHLELGRALFSLTFIIHEVMTACASREWIACGKTTYS